MQDRPGSALEHGPLREAEACVVRHLRQILAWPVYLLPRDDEAPIQDHLAELMEPSEDNPWREIEDEFGDPAEFQERHYNEFVTFVPAVQRFLYGQGLGKMAHRTGYGESPIRVLRRCDVASVRITLQKGDTALTLDIAHIDLYFFFDIDVAILALEITADEIPLKTAEDLLFRFGRAYPAYWEKDGRGGHCPYKTEWLSKSGDVLATSDFEQREKFLSFVCQHRAPRVAQHWEYLMSPLVPHQSDIPDRIRYRQLEYYRMPYMAFMAFDDLNQVTRADRVRLTLGNGPAPNDDLPYSHGYLGDFERKYSYDRYGDDQGGGIQFMTSGPTLIVMGSSRDAFFMDFEGGLLSRFRHQHFLLFLVAHFQKAALQMFSDRAVATISKLDVRDPRANAKFRREIRLSLENFLRFEHRYWFHAISNHAQSRDLFRMLHEHLGLEAAYKEVREELQDMGNFLDVEATRRQNESMIRLTVVTTFGLIGTITTGFLGMNILAWAEQPAEWRIWAFTAVFLPTTILTLYTVMKSQRLSEFLDSLSDERLGLWGKIKAFFRIWF